MPVPPAVRARLGLNFLQARAQPLARHLKKSERRDTSDLDSCPVGAHCVFQRAFHLVLVAVVFHVDEVDHDEAGKVAEPELAGDFLGRFDIGLVCRLLDIALARRAAGVDVDGDQRLGRVDDDVAAGFKLHFG